MRKVVLNYPTSFYININSMNTCDVTMQVKHGYMLEKIHYTNKKYNTNTCAGVEPAQYFA